MLRMPMQHFTAPFRLVAGYTVENSMTLRCSNITSSHPIHLVLFTGQLENALRLLLEVGGRLGAQQTINGLFNGQIYIKMEDVQGVTSGRGA